MCTKGFLNYLSVIVVFLNVVFKDESVKFSKNYGIVKPKKKNLLEIFKNCKSIIIVIINCQNGSGKPRKLSKFRMTKWTAIKFVSRNLVTQKYESFIPI